jgi:hypothetical protein
MVRPPTATAEGTPERPSYPVISSGWDSEDEEARGGKSSDLMTALRAVVVLALFVFAVSLLIR